MTLGPREPQGTAFAPIFEAMHRGLLQRERLLKLDTPLGANTLIPLRALGCAQLGRDYTWTIDAATTRDDLNPDALIAQPVTLWMQPPRGVLDLNADYRPIHGYVHTVRRRRPDVVANRLFVRAAFSPASPRRAFLARPRCAGNPVRGVQSLSAASGAHSGSN
ncbi:contractile injection system protein, VgrG/Pvc8 family [Burkholderia thailandensis]|uniref:contractile injection system protein, VgrG/Pvc8 family n=1 Tax=Burkholderia thailandensis TaxID=57975 RepID=UPI003B435F50